jgi:site-specific DNA recombinase
MPPRKHDPGDLIPAIGYIRVSMLQEEQISPEIQRHAITDWARRKGRRIVRWIEDLDVSGRTFHRKIMEGIQAIEDGEAREIAVWKYSRYGRNRTGNAINLGRINRAGGELQSATEDVDARTAVGKLTRGMLMEIAAFESDRTGEQWAEAHANRHARGLPAHGRDRFGYRLRGRVPDPLQPHRTIRAPDDGDERYEIDPRTGPALAELYYRYTAGEGARALSGWLNDAGLRTSRGNRWSDSVLLRMLDAGFGAGLLRVHDVNCSCHEPGRCPNKILVEGAQKPVITDAEWKAYRRRRDRVARTAPRARVSVYPLSGRMRCGHCGGSMSITANGSTPGVWYHCTAYMRKRVCAARSARRLVVEERVLEVLAEWAEEIEKQPIRPVQRVAINADLDAIQTEIGDADKALDRLTLQFAKGLIPDDTYMRTRDSLLADRAHASVRLEELTRPAPRERHEYVPVIEALVSEWPSLPADDRREMVAEVLSVVRVFRESRTSAWVEIVSAWGEMRTALL